MIWIQNNSFAIFIFYRRYALAPPCSSCPSLLLIIVRIEGINNAWPAKHSLYYSAPQSMTSVQDITCVTGWYTTTPTNEKVF
jgi:hypothetical protein